MACFDGKLCPLSERCFQPFSREEELASIPIEQFLSGPLVVTLLLSFFVLVALRPALAQTAIGIQQFGAYDGFPDTVDVGTLRLGFMIPIYRKQGRGSGTGIDITLTEQGAWPASQACNSNLTTCLALNLGPQVSFGMTAVGTYADKGTTHNCAAIPNSQTYTDYSWTYTDPRGTAHSFFGSSRGINSGGVLICSSSGYTAYGLTAQASDGSGYLIQVGSSGYWPVTVTDPSGRILSWGSNVGPNNLQDSNGNILKSSWGGAITKTDNLGNIINYSITDTVGTTFSMSGGGSSSDFSSRQPLYITYLDDLGNVQTITIAYKVYLCWPGLSTGGNCGLMDSITYPDGSAYHFTYQLSSSGLPQYGAYTLASITLPTGGTISYAYSQSSYYCPAIGSNFNYLSGLSRTTSDGATNYTRTITSQASVPYCAPNASWTKIVKPNGDQTNVYFVVPQVPGASPSGYLLDTNRTHETKRIEYSHTNLSTPVRTTMRCYNTNTGDCTTISFNEPVSQLAITTTLDNGLSSKVVTQYTAAGLLPSEVDEYDFGATSPTRKTITQYASLTNNISDKPATVTVYDSAGNLAKKTTYSYDAVTPPPMTLPGHVTIASGNRGNPTSVTEQINSSGTTVMTQYVYDDAGQVTSSTDPKGNATSYGYDTATDAYKIKVTRPTTNGVSHVSTFAYGPNSGLVTSTHDENNQLTSYVYDSVYRLSSVTYPDGGQTTYSYSLSPTSKTTNVLLQTGTWMTTVAQLDAYGRPSQTQLTTDPSGTTYTVTTYDSLGRRSSVYNPTRCNPPTTNCQESTWGVTTYQYDALNRVTSVGEPDGSTANNSYSGNCTTTTDEAGNQRKSCSDGLGRLTGVWEAPNLTSTYNYETDYAYDALNNLLSVNQKGGSTNSANWRTRTFTYDWLSRLLCAANPEIQTVTCPTSSTGTFPALATLYTYDGNGNVLTKTAPSPNQPSTGTKTVTTTYTYDTLNRLTGKSYNDSYTANPATPSVTYGYDEVNLSCPTPVGFAGSSATNGIGRRTAMCFGAGSKSWQFDPMGRIYTQNDRFIGLVAPFSGTVSTVNGVPTISTNTEFHYYLNGDLGTLYYPQPGIPNMEFFTAESAAGRVITAGDSANNVLEVGTYTPDGQLATATNGRLGAYSGNKISNTYNNRLQPVLISAATATGASILNLTYNFNLGNGTTGSDNGNVIQLASGKDSNRTQNFSYDSLNRILNAYTNGPNWGETYTTDAWGNMTAIGSYGGKPHESLSTSATTKNQLAAFVYDTAGNLIQNGSTSYTYDAENRLISTNANGSHSYIYDADGQRIEKCTAGTIPGTCSSTATGTFYWKLPDGSNQAESDLGGNWTATYGLIRGRIASRVDLPSNVIHYYFQDHLSSTNIVTDAQGNILKESDYYPYGGEIPISGSDANHYKFTGKEHDSESGLDNFGARYDASSLGRFMTPDPSGLLAQHPEDPQSWNLYAYVRNNPLIYLDPNGLDCIYATNNGKGVESIDHDSSSGECGQNGGTWLSGYVDEDWAHYSNRAKAFEAASEDGGQVNFAQFQAGAQTNDSGNCLSGCGSYGFASASGDWLTGQFVGNSKPTDGSDPLDGLLTFMTKRNQAVSDFWKVIAGPLDPSKDNWAGPGGMGPPGGRGDWAAAVHDYNFETNHIKIGSYFNPFLSPATSRALIKSNNTLMRNAGGIQSLKMGLFFGPVNALQWYANSWK